MTTPFMFESLILLPKTLSFIVMIGLIVAGISELRKSHIGRVGIFLNSLMLWQIFYDSFATLPNWFQWYLNIGTVIGIIAILAYLNGNKLPNVFYQVCFLLYGSISVLLAILVFATNLFMQKEVIETASNLTNITRSK